MQSIFESTILSKIDLYYLRMYMQFPKLYQQFINLMGLK